MKQLADHTLHYCMQVNEMWEHRLALVYVEILFLPFVAADSWEWAAAFQNLQCTARMKL
jgi:hypothetical protein